MHGEHDLALFWERGWLHVPAVVSPAELLRVAEHVGNVRQPPPSERHLFRHYPFQGFVADKCLNELNEREVRDTERLMRLHLFDRETRALMLDARVVAIARAIFRGAEPLGAHSAYLPKSPGSPGISLHTDRAIGSDCQPLFCADGSTCEVPVAPKRM